VFEFCVVEVRELSLTSQIPLKISMLVCFWRIKGVDGQLWSGNGVVMVSS